MDVQQDGQLVSRGRAIGSPYVESKAVLRDLSDIVICVPDAIYTVRKLLRTRWALSNNQLISLMLDSQ